MLVNLAGTCLTARRSIGHIHARGPESGAAGLDEKRLRLYPRRGGLIIIGFNLLII